MPVIQTIKSQNNNNIELIEIKPPLYEKTILIIGVFHGDEPEGEFLIKKYLEDLPENLKNRLLFIPCLNPDGKELKTRQNANKIDLNRNFATKNWKKSDNEDYFGGNEPNSEIETRFLIYVIEQFEPDCILTLHTPYKIVNFDGPAQDLATKISELTSYPLQQDIGYPTPGSFGTYCGIERNIPIITLELPDNEPKENLWKQNKKVFDYFTFDYE